MDPVTLRPARPGDGEALFDITRRSVEALAKHHYTPEQIAGWMGERTPAYYEDLIVKGEVVVAEFKRTVMGFVDSEPGEVTRLFLLPGVAGSGLGARLLTIGIENARKGHSGPIKVESTVNAEGFYRRHGFRTIERGYFSHGLGGDPLEIVHMELIHDTSAHDQVEFTSCLPRRLLWPRNRRAILARSRARSLDL